MIVNNNKLSELHKRIDEILFYKWDPIGINYTAYARDEYYSYISAIAKLAQEDNCVEKMTEHLNSIQVVSMCLSSNIEKCREVSEDINEWCILLGFQKDE